MGSAHFLVSLGEGLHGVDLAHELRLKIRGFVLVDDAAFGQFVDDGDHLGQALGGSGLVAEGAEVTQSVAHGLGVVTVLYSSFFARANSFLCRLVVCHLFIVSLFLIYYLLLGTACGIRTRDFKNENLTSWAN